MDREIKHPLLEVRTRDTTTVLLAAGPWTAGRAGDIDAEINRVASAELSPGEIAIDMSAVEQCDTYGATLLSRLVMDCEKRGSRVRIVGLEDRFAGLVEAVRQVRGPAEETSPAGGRLLAWQRSVVSGGTAALQSGIGLLDMLGAVGAWLASTARQPAQFRFVSTVHQLDRIAVQAVPIIALITFLIGGIIAQQGFFHFRKFGADQYVVDMVGILVLREIAVLIVAIMVAGRSGSSITAELGSMKMREEIDALRTMGHDPVVVLILPRLIALVVALPALTFLGILSALYGGGLVAWLYGDMNPGIFIARLKDALSVTHFEVGMIKAPFMALIIGLVACSEGLQVRGSAESLGLRTTASVVKSIFLVIALDGFFAMYFASIGM